MILHSEDGKEINEENPLHMQVSGSIVTHKRIGEPIVGIEGVDFGYYGETAALSGGILPITPYDISQSLDRVLYLKNNASQQLKYKLLFYDELENVTNIDHIFNTPDEYLAAGASIFIDVSIVKQLGYPFKGLCIGTASSTATGTFDMRLLKGAR